MSGCELPCPGEVREILVWHQGALGDVLLAGPALVGLSRHFPQARFTALGRPEYWSLLAGTLPLAQVWDGGAARWAALFEAGHLPPGLEAALSSFQLALIFSPRPNEALLARLRQAGIPTVAWLPSFPLNGTEAAAALQARGLAELGLAAALQPFRLSLPTHSDAETMPLHGPGPWLAVAPGSGHPTKNWPLAHYYELSRALAWEAGLKVAWLLGPAEAHLQPYVQGLAAAQDHLLLTDLPLAQVAAALSRCRLYVGNDSGLTHLAAASGAAKVLALFGPTDPQAWAPWGEQVQALTGPCPQAPCADARQIVCQEAACLQNLSPDTVKTAALAMLTPP